MESSALSFESRLCHGVEAFEGAAPLQHDNNSSSSSELLQTDSLLYRAGGIKRKAAGKVLEGDDSMKCSKSKPNSGDGSLKASSKLQQQPADFPKQDYIHVRARRGQATDSHSLAERVRREKISERMKFLQDLVPGCSKITGKAVMLDEIINYVQSLQRQIEFLSMKLAAVDSQLDINVESLLSKELARSPETKLMGPDPSTGYSEFQLQQQINNCNIDLRSVGTLCDAYLRSSMNRSPLPLAPPTFANSFPEPSTQTLYDGDLQTIVHNVGNSQGSRQEFFAQGRHHGPGFMYPGFLKVEH